MRKYVNDIATAVNATALHIKLTRLKKTSSKFCVQYNLHTTQFIQHHKIQSRQAICQE